MSSDHIILVSVLQGRNLPRKLLYVQCKFNDEILTTDPVQGPSPTWNTELGWTVQHRQLSFLRSLRSSLKLIVYELGDARNSLGYGSLSLQVMLDLRAATSKQTEKWVALTNPRLQSSSFRPEIKISFSVSAEPAQFLQVAGYGY